MPENTTPHQFLDRGYADMFASRRVCARCYGDLSVMPGDHRTWTAECPTCGDAWGYATISRAYAEQLGQRALAERREATENLPDLFPNPHKGKSPNQILKELGLGE